ncbi:type II secretion system minor pseudopilin GspH [Shewanella gaetbuli]|uniref:Type II secretion system protein H n=1 Tax=Shewanella gaetbuli TaxID=220752 RepID=A0A9X1ZKX3_9GAMM|nr:type II secretion system minor pseudopilin GspH [Shewanella gaetbuli]MCL1144204.1 type II secretion system minor pseudopilin GspH [Shewanella gaetbuli]
MNKHCQAGFTLLEVLLVALLMGLAASAVTISMSSAGPEQTLNKQAKRFIAAAELVLDETVLSGQFIGIVVEDTQYQFVAYEDGKWVTIEDDKHLAVHELEPGIKLDLLLDGMPLDQEDEDQDSWFDEPFIDEKTEEEKRKNPEPQILLFPSGEVTPFELTFMTVNENRTPIDVVVVGDAIGRLSLGFIDE